LYRRNERSPWLAPEVHSSLLKNPFLIGFSVVFDTARTAYATYLPQIIQTARPAYFSYAMLISQTM